MNTTGLIISGLTLSAIFTGAIVSCDTSYEKNLQQSRAMTLTRAECPDGMKDEARQRIVLGAAYHSSDIKRLNDEKVAICVNPALAAAKTLPPYSHPIAAVYLPPADGKGPMLQIWDDGNPPKKLRPIMNGMSVISHPPQAYRGVIGILDHAARRDPSKPYIAIADGECGYSCVGINWYGPDKPDHQQLLKDNPTLLSRPGISLPK